MTKQTESPYLISGTPMPSMSLFGPRSPFSCCVDIEKHGLTLPNIQQRGREKQRIHTHIIYLRLSYFKARVLTVHGHWNMTNGDVLWLDRNRGGRLRTAHSLACQDVAAGLISSAMFLARQRWSDAADCSRQQVAGNILMPMFNMAKRWPL